MPASLYSQENEPRQGNCFPATPAPVLRLLLLLDAAVLFLLLFSQGDRQQQQKEARESSVRRCPGFLIHLYVASIEKHASSRRNFGMSLFTHLRKIYVAICFLTL